MTRKPKFLVECGCECGTMLIGKFGKKVQYVHGHNLKVLWRKDGEKDYSLRRSGGVRKNRIRKCLECGKEELVFWPRMDTKFCSVKCSNKYHGRNGMIGGDRTSLSSFIKVYGEEEGKVKYDKLVEWRSENIHMPSRKGVKLSKEVIDKCVKGRAKYNQSIKGRTFDEIRGEGKREELSKKMKGTFTLDWFIKKYGSEEGRLLYEERSNHLKEVTPFKNPNIMNRNKNTFSKKSQRLFWNLHKLLSSEKERMYFGELNHEYSCGTRRNYDFVMPDRKKVIEFYGNRFHANPKIFSEVDTPDPFHKNRTSKEIRERDRVTVEILKNKGFEVFIVWEEDFDRNEEESTKKCLEFLLGSTNEARSV